MRIVKSREVEKWSWVGLLGCQVLILLFFTPLQGADSAVYLFMAANVLSWPLSVILLMYYLKGRLSEQENQTKHLVLVGVGLGWGLFLMYFMIPLSVVWLAGLAFFLVILFLAGRKLLQERQHRKRANEGGK